MIVSAGETTSKNVHALLIGIDAYPPEIRQLWACANDVDAIYDVLSQRCKIPNITRLIASHDTTRNTSPPTRENIREALSKLASAEVAGEDCVFIYYAGHGRRYSIVDGDSRITREALIACDGVPIFDWEFNAQLVDIARTTPNLIVVLDCCHSASVTRGTQSRSIRGLPESVVHDAALKTAAPAVELRGIGRQRSTDLRSALIIAACGEDQEAAEVSGHGILTRALLDEFYSITDESIHTHTWWMSWPNIRETVESAIPNHDQHPRYIGDLSRGLFGSHVAKREPGLFLAEREGADTIKVGAGSLADVTRGARIAVYGPTPTRFPPLGTPEDTTARIGTLIVTDANRHHAEARFEDPGLQLPDDARGRLIETGAPWRLPIFVDSRLPSELLQEIRGSQLYSCVGVRESAEAWIESTQDGRAVTLRDRVFDGVSREFVGAEIKLNADDAGLQARRVLEHYTRYTRPLRLARHSFEIADALSIEVLNCGSRWRFEGEEAQAPSLGRVDEHDGIPTVTLGALYCLRVHNHRHYEHNLKVALFECGVNGVVIYHGDAMIGDHRTSTGELIVSKQHVFWFRSRLGIACRADPPAGLSRFVAIGTTSPAADLRNLATIETFASARDREFKRVSGPPSSSGLIELWTGALISLNAVDTATAP